MKEHLLFHSCLRYVSVGPPHLRWSPERNGLPHLESAGSSLMTHCFAFQLASCALLICFFFFSEVVLFLSGTIVDDAEYFRILITVWCSSSVIAADKADCVDVDIIDIGIKRIGVCDDTWWARAKNVFARSITSPLIPESLCTTKRIRGWSTPFT